MKQSELFKGILPAIITPVDKDEVFAPATYKKLVESVYAAGVHGLLEDREIENETSDPVLPLGL